MNQNLGKTAECNHHKICNFSTSDFIMKYCFNVNYLADIERTRFILFNDVFGLYVAASSPEKLKGFIRSTARKYVREWRRRWEHVVPLTSCNSRKIWVISVRLHWTSEKLKALIACIEDCMGTYSRDSLMDPIKIKLWLTLAMHV